MPLPEERQLNEALPRLLLCYRIWSGGPWSIMSIYIRTLAAALCLAALNMNAVPAQSPAIGCSNDKNHYSCDKARFTKALNAARVVAVETHPLNQVSAGALERLARELGKSVQSGSADLIFELGALDPDGIYIGPNDRELASLRVFQPGPKGERGQLLWVESFIGQPDMPWPMVVHGVILQFKNEFK